MRAPQPIPDPQLLNPAIGQRQSNPTFFLRGTPPIFTVLNVGGSNTNQDFAFKATQIPETRPAFSRAYRLPFAAPGAPPTTITTDYVIDFATAGKVTAKSTITTDYTISFDTGGAASPTASGGLYSSLIEADRPVAWWGLDSTTATADETGHGYDLTANGSPTSIATLLSHGNETNGAARDFNGSSDAYWTLGTLYEDPDVPPSFHAATAAANNTTTTSLVTPSGIQAGDLVLACIAHTAQTATISSAPSGWTQVGSTLNAGNCAVAVYKRLPISDEPPDEFTWTWSATGTTLGTVLVYRNCDQAVSGLVYDSGQVATTSGSFHSTTTESSPIQSHAVAFWVGEFNGTITPEPTGLKRRADISTSNLRIYAAEYDVAVGGNVTKTATTNANTQLGAFLLTFGAPNEIAEDALDSIAEHVSIHALIRPDTVGAGTRTIIRKHQAWGLQLNAATVEFVYRDGGGVDRTITGPTVSASTVTHLVVTDDGTDIHFYKNGAETTASRTGAAGYTVNAERVTIGAYHNGTSFTNFFDGRIDEPAVWSAPVSDDMVAAWYEAHNAGTFGTQLLGTHGVGVYPRLKLEIAWASNPTDDCLVWEDVTADLRGHVEVNTTRGRNFELDRIESGRMNFTLDNRERQYDDTFASSPYYPNVKPTRAVRLRAQATTDNTAHPIFFGYTEGHPLLRISYGKDSVAQFNAIDVFKALSLDKVLGTYVRPNEYTGERLEALLDGLPGVPYSGDAGQTLLVGEDLNGVNSLDHAQQVAETEGGVFFADRAGTATFQDRHYRVRNERDVRATYGDGPGELPVKHMEPMTDESRLFTAAAVTPASGNVQRSIDATGSLSHFVRTKEITTLAALDNDAAAQAEAFAFRYATARTRIPEVVLQPAGHSSPQTMWETVLAHDLSHRIATVERPIGDASSITRQHFVEGISHSISAQDWQVRLSVSPAELEGEFWLLGTGELGDTSGLTATVLGW